MIANRHAGLGLGLRTEHYNDFLAAPQAVDWLEIITDNYLVDGGKPLAVLDTIRQDYPLAMHGVAMSIGSADGLDRDYLRRVKALADRVQPMWVSDHLCWGGWRGQVLHDLYPMPYTEAAASHLIAHIQQAQDVLQRRLVIENVSSYITYRCSVTTEWDFLRYVVEQADCLLLADVNNIYVSSVNHGFDPLTYLDAIPGERVQQMHLAGHSYQDDLIVDTHDHPVCDAVWDLFAQACQRWGHVPSMIERDDDVPPLPDLLEELAHARQVVAQHAGAPKPSAALAAQAAVATPSATTAAPTVAPAWPASPELAWRDSQASMVKHVLTPRVAPAADWVVADTAEQAQTRAGVYRFAYRARLAAALAESFERVNLYVGSDDFAMVAKAFGVTHPPVVRSLGNYGDGLPDYLASLFPGANALVELAQLDWDLRKRFDAADSPALSAQAPHALSQALDQAKVLHPTCVLRTITTNVVKIWQAIANDEEVPEATDLAQPARLLVWRMGYNPQFRTLDPGEDVFLDALAAGETINTTAERLSANGTITTPNTLAVWLRRWLDEGLLADVSAATGRDTDIAVNVSTEATVAHGVEAQRNST
jgi:uncharacterized protein (UPF0276 family)